MEARESTEDGGGVWRGGVSSFPIGGGFSGEDLTRFF